MCGLIWDFLLLIPTASTYETTSVRGSCSYHWQIVDVLSANLKVLIWSALFDLFYKVSLQEIHQTDDGNNDGRGDRNDF